MNSSLEKNILKEFLYCTAVYLAAENGHHNIIKYLDNLPFTLSEYINDKFTAFYLAARTGQLDIIKYFIEENIFIPENKQINTQNKSDLNIYIVDEDINDECNGINDSMLLIASKYGNLALLEKLLNKGVNIESADKYGNTALHYAAMKGHENIILKLLKKGANMWAINKDQNKPIQLAAINGYNAVVKILIENGAYINAIDKNKDTLLHYSVRNGHISLTEQLLKLGAKCLVNKNGRIPLHYACNTKITELLLNYQADIDCKDIDGNTPLHTAVVNGYIDVLRVLLKYNPNIESKNNDSLTSLHVAVQKGMEDSVKLLIKNKANIEEKNDNGYSSLLISVNHAQYHITTLLLEFGADINSKTCINSSVLHIAAQCGGKDMVLHFLRHGIDVDCTNKYFWTPLMYAAKANNVIAGQILLEWNANINHTISNKISVLHIATTNKCLNFVNLLLKHEIDITKDNNSCTPLDLAITMKHIDIQKAIQNYMDNNEK